MHGPYLKRSQTGVYNFGTICEQPAVEGRSVAAVTNKVPYVLQLEPSPLRLPMLHSSILQCSPASVGLAQARPTLVVKTENCLYICMFVWYVRIPYMHSALFVRDEIFPHVCMHR